MCPPWQLWVRDCYFYDMHVLYVFSYAYLCFLVVDDTFVDDHLAVEALLHELDHDVTVLGR